MNIQCNKSIIFFMNSQEINLIYWKNVHIFDSFSLWNITLGLCIEIKFKFQRVISMAITQRANLDGH